MSDLPLFKLLLEVLHQTRDGVGVFDSGDRLVFCNQSFGQLFALSKEQATGQTFPDLIRHVHQASTGLLFDTPDIEQLLQQVAKKKRRSVAYRTFENITREGTWHLITQQVTDDDYMLVFCTDISEQKRAEMRERELADKFKRLSETDELTGISNRRSFFARVAKQLQYCRRQQLPGVLLSFDIDHFKLINDNYGHGCGDDVLRQLPALIAECLRPYDLFGRIGGEEFSIFVVDADSTLGLSIAERILKRVENHDFGPPLTPSSVTVSVGMAEVGHSYDLEHLMHAADMALYEAKRMGRNCVRVAVDSTHGYEGATNWAQTLVKVPMEVDMVVDMVSGDNER
ncbi:diguanylate cyclase [Aestuariirhabdus sp. Z084]|uniref:sensor domain-containing diguanylate cyclase n=1 Tax=Aestuariirhabdus haliotis TaxID=2918751 RepID=UPI00201B443F|nr:sensor domain-containing diguanylate cyclase [Aestuariirhabdus haliotis]MCL6414403.1 diguanylate cyclase [Aestuariirhabdus haliotis]MCL6418335.1 diguanylate cyclase [Aestuariirhabdus haliotis]